VSDQTLWNTNRTIPIQFRNSLLVTTYVVTRNIHITITRFVSIVLHFHIISLILLLNSWHSNDPEPKVHLLLLKAKLHLSPASCLWWPTSLTNHIPPTVTCAQSLAYRLCNRKVMSLWAQKSCSIGIIPVTRRDRDGKEKIIFKNRECPTEVCMCGVSIQQWPST